MGFGCIQVSA
jgi:hypothetical protein